MVQDKIAFEKAIHILGTHTQRNIAKASVHVLVTLIFLWSGIIASHYCYHHFAWGLIISVPITIVFMCRSYVMEHDCGHGSMFSSKASNFIIGNLMGFGILIPYSLWKYIHDSHHMNVGNLDRRAFNPEIWTITLHEYQTASMFKKIAYRFMRSKFTRFLLAPTINMGIVFRIVNKRFNWKANVSIIIHDVLYGFAIYYFILEFSLVEFLFIFYLPLVFFYFIASFTFYAQHQFEDTYWEKAENWDYHEASFHGATFIDAPKWYCWLTGNVVYHNIHHLMSSIPFYRLNEAQLALGQIIPYKRIPLSEVFQMLSLKLWDESKKKMVPFPKTTN